MAINAPKLSPRFNIAIAGHGSERINSAAKHTLAAIKSAMSVLIKELAEQSQVFVQSDHKAKDVYNLEKGVKLRLLTGNFDGADQLAMEIAREQQHHLALILPENSNHSVADEILCFNASSSQPGVHLPEEVYQQRDDLLLAQANMLMVVWDGQFNPSRKSGTTWLIQQALLRNIPVYWLDIGHSSLSWLVHTAAHRLTIEEEVFCQQLFYDWSEAKAAEFKTRFFKAQAKNLEQEVIQQVFLPNAFFADHKDHETNKKHNVTSITSPMICKIFKDHEDNKKPNVTISQFFQHKFTLAKTGGFEKFMHALFRLNGKDMLSGIKSFFSFGNNESKNNSMFTFVASAANDVSGRYRSSIWLTYLMSPLAVLAAVMGVLPSLDTHAVHEAGHHASVHWTAYAELGLIGGILLIVALASFQNWHKWWLPLRSNAEMLRYHTNLSDEYGKQALGIGALSTPLLRLPATSWEHWLFKRVYVNLPLADQKYLTTKGLKEGLEALIEDQLSYHAGKSEKEHSLHHFLHWASLILFAVTLLAVVIHFFEHYSWLLIATAAFPAFAAAIHGILTMSESERISEQSHEMVHQLCAYHTALKALPDDESWTTMLATRNIATQVVSLMVNETQSWQSLIRFRAPGLPA